MDDGTGGDGAHPPNGGGHQQPQQHAVNEREGQPDDDGGGVMIGPPPPPPPLPQQQQQAPPLQQAIVVPLEGDATSSDNIVVPVVAVAVDNSAQTMAAEVEVAPMEFEPPSEAALQIWNEVDLGLKKNSTGEFCIGWAVADGCAKLLVRM